MNRNRILPLLLIAIGSLGAIVATSGHRQPGPERLNASVPGREVPSLQIAQHVRNHDDVAMEDITLQAFGDVSDPSVVPSEMESRPSWTPKWELRWRDFTNQGGHTTRVYHATLRRYPYVRFTSVQNIEEGTTRDWQLVQ